MENPVRPKYKIKLSGIAPDMSLAQLAKFRKCYLGVSINNPFFRDRHLGLLLKWIASHFDECIILIGDYLHRINENILHGNTGETAIASSINRGDQIHEMIDIALSILPKNKFKVYRWKEFLDKNPRSFTKKDELNFLFENNRTFHESILLSCSEFVERLIKRGERLYFTREEAIALSREYLIEEMSVFSTLIEMGYNVQVYPGTQLKVLKDLARHAFPAVESNLSAGIYVDLTVKKIKK